MATSPTSLVDQHARLTGELADTLRELASVRKVLLTRRAEIWNETRDLGVTERRDTIVHATADIAGEVVELEGDVEALRVELAGVEWSGS